MDPNQFANQLGSIDFKNTTKVLPSEGVAFDTKMILRKVSKFVAGTDEDLLLPIPVFIDPATGKILKDTLPPELRDEYEEYTI